MKPTRTLSLKKETLTELATEDLRAVVGASGPTCNYGACASDFQQCFTGHGCTTVTDLTVVTC